jgi:iron complex outermembrane receptor protein
MMRFLSTSWYSMLAFLFAFLFLLGGVSAPAEAQSPAPAAGALRGKVTLASNGEGLHKAIISVVGLNRSTESGEDGSYEFSGLPAGRFDVVVHAAAFSDERRRVEIRAGQVSTQDFQMRLAPVRTEITVTASGREEVALESFQVTSTLQAVDLAQRPHTSLGEVLEGESGVSKRSFGPGSSRPVLRGFDGDRVLIMQDGLSTGSLSSQSGDHGEMLNVLNLERLEIVRGPATLLYGSNAVGGVVNAITGHQQIFEHAHPGLSGYLTATGGSGNALGGGSAGFEYGVKNWLIWGGGGGQRTGDYRAPAGTIVNSRTRSADARAGFGWYGKKGFFSLDYDYDNRRYGVPFAAFLENGPPFNPDDEIINLRPRRHDVKFNGGFRGLSGAITDVRVALGYSDYRHGEYEGDSVETQFFNKQFHYRFTFEQKKRGPLTGTFGFSGLARDYRVEGDEALAPPVRQNGFALFTLQTIDFERVGLQFGARFEHVGYDAGSLPLRPPFRDRSFNGFSGAAGVRFRLWPGGALVANYTHSFRTPALEELYNEGPHPGNLAFEIGNQNLRRERGDGLDLSLRHQSVRLHAEANFFYYRLDNYVFLSPTGNISPEGLFEAEFLQADTRYFGGEFSLSAQVHPNLWLLGGVDAVDAELREAVLSPITSVVTPAGTPLPRIPPLRGRVGVDFRWRGLSVRPEGVFARSQERLFVTETRTAGWALFNLAASYTLARQHAVHVFAVNAFNLNDQLYRNHLSFIKDLAPEIGRGVSVSYTLRFN